MADDYTEFTPVGGQDAPAPALPSIGNFTSKSGVKFSMSPDVGDKASQLIDFLNDNGYKIKAADGFQPRFVHGTTVPSDHATGLAIDLNASQNAQGTRGNIPRALAMAAAQKFGARWGGTFSDPDPMHFSWGNNEGGTLPVNRQQAMAAVRAAQAGHPAFQSYAAPPQAPQDTVGAVGVSSQPDDYSTFKPVQDDYSGFQPVQQSSSPQPKESFGGGQGPIPLQGGVGVHAPLSGSIGTQAQPINNNPTHGTSLLAGVEEGIAGLPNMPAVNPVHGIIDRLQQAGVHVPGALADAYDPQKLIEGAGGALTGFNPENIEAPTPTDRILRATGQGIGTAIIPGEGELSLGRVAASAAKNALVGGAFGGASQGAEEAAPDWAKPIVGPLAGVPAAIIAHKALDVGASRIMDGISAAKKNYDVTQDLTQSSNGAPVSDFVKSLFTNRGMDTTPPVDPRSAGTRAPITGNTPVMSPEEQTQFKQVLKTGSVDDIKQFLSDKQGPQPTWEDVNQLVSLRDQVPGGATNSDNIHEAIGQQIDQAHHQVVQDHLSNLTSGWKNAPDFEVINHSNDIQDPNIRAQAQAEDTNGDALGFLGSDKKVRIFGNRVESPDQLNALIYHEGLGHFGLAEKFGDKLDSTLTTLLSRNVGQFGKDVDAWQKANPNAYGGDRLRAAEEVLAEKSQNGQMKPSVMAGISASVRQFGRKMGLKLSYSDGEIDHILSMAHDAVVSGKGRNVTDNGFAGGKSGAKPGAWLNMDHGSAHGETNVTINGKTETNRFMFTGQHATDFTPRTLNRVRGSDGHLRNEISDQGARLKDVDQHEVRPFDDPHTLGDILHHPDLYRQYPELKDLPVDYHNILETRGHLGAYDPATRTMHLDNSARDFDPLSTVLHETQHAIQHIEGHISSNELGPMTDEQYAADPRENEARATEARRTMTQPERALEPARFMRRNALGDTLADPEDEIDRLKADPRFWSDPEYRQNVIEKIRSMGDIDPAREPEKTQYKYKNEAEARAAQNVFMRKTQLASSQDYKARDLEEAYNALTKDYHPTTVPWEENQAAALKAGFSPGQIRDLKTTNPGELSTKLWRIQSATNMADEKLSRLEDRITSGNFTDEDQKNYLQTLADFHYLVVRAKGEKAEIARALNVSKAASYTNKSMEEMAQVLRDRDSGLANLADRDTFLKFAKDIQELREKGNPEAAHEKMMAVDKPYWEQYLNTLHMNFMLSALSTHVKAPIDMATGIARDVIEKVVAMPIGVARTEIMKALGHTPQVGVGPAEIVANLHGVMKAVTDAEVYRKMGNAVRTGEGSYVTDGEATSTAFSNTYGSISNPHIKGASLPTDLISAQDTFFRSVEMNKQLLGLAARQAQEELGRGASMDDVLIRANAIARQPTIPVLQEAQEAVERAMKEYGRTTQLEEQLGDIKEKIAFKNQALDNTNRTLLLNNNKLNAAVDKYRAYKPGLGVWGRVGRFIVGNLAPFIRVESNNLINRVIQRSPLAVLDPYTIGEIKAGGARADLAMARIAYGTVLLGMSWAAADKTKNYLTGNGPDNVNKFKELQAGGYSPRSVHENGRYNVSDSLSLSLNPFDQHNATATMVAGAREAWENGGGKANVALSLALAAGSVFHNLSTMTWINDFAPAVDAITAKGTEGSQKVNQFIGEEAKTWTPNLLGQAARLIDPNQHTLVESGPLGAGKTIANEVQSAIPFASKGLPIHYSVYGDPLSNGASLTGVHTVIPGLEGNGRTEPTDPAKQELMRLAKASPAAIITPVLRTVTLDDGTKKRLNPYEFGEYQRQAGQAIVEAVRQAMNSPSWQTMSDRDKIEQVRDIQSDSKEDVRDKMFNAQ